MIRGRARFQVYQGGLLTLSRDTTQAAARKGANQARERVRQNIYKAGRVDTGKMARGLVVEAGRSSGYRTLYRVRATTPYYRFQEDGTRAHGPVKAKYMRFKPKGSSTFVFARWVRGVTPGRFMRNAIAQMRAEDFA